MLHRFGGCMYKKDFPDRYCSPSLVCESCMIQNYTRMGELWAFATMAWGETKVIPLRPVWRVGPWAFSATSRLLWVQTWLFFFFGSGFVPIQSVVLLSEILGGLGSGSIYRTVGECSVTICDGSRAHGKRFVSIYLWKTHLNSFTKFPAHLLSPRNPGESSPPPSSTHFWFSH